MIRRRQIISAAESAAMFAQRQQRKQEQMTPADVQALIRKTICDGLDRDATVTRDDLLRSNVPAASIDLYFSLILLEVIRERQAQRRQEGKVQ